MVKRSRDNGQNCETKVTLGELAFSVSAGIRNEFPDTLVPSESLTVEISFQLSIPTQTCQDWTIQYG